MAKIRILEISNFRAIKQLRWHPIAGVNCLIGPGDSGKSSILEAIDLCLGARRSVTFSDADFNCLDTSSPIVISLTLGDLDDSTKSMESYGQFLRGFNADTGEIEDEPDSGLETVLTVRMTVAGDLDPQWALYSERAKAADISRNLSWGDRQKLAPAKIGGYGSNHLSWRRGSVLTRLADETADISAELANAAREARSNFGDKADVKLRKTLEIVEKTAGSVGIDIGGSAKALLDVEAVSVVGGSISVHDGDGVPLSALGVGSTRLLVTALQSAAASNQGIILLDELEHGLEPHRIIRLIHLLRAKDDEPTQQAFVTTHSPVALKEFSGDQLFIVRKLSTEHSVASVGLDDDMQGAIRSYPEAFLAPSVLVCEGASEVGFVRGVSHSRIAKGKKGTEAHGVALVNGNGGSPKKLIERGTIFLRLGYRVAIFMDSDVPVNAIDEAEFGKVGGVIIRWQDGHALEDALFQFLPDEAVGKLVDKAVEFLDEDIVGNHISLTSGGTLTLKGFRAEVDFVNIEPDTRKYLAKAAKKGKTGSAKVGWFKTLGHMEDVTFAIVIPYFSKCDSTFQSKIVSLWKWIAGER